METLGWRQPKEKKRKEARAGSCLDPAAVAARSTKSLKLAVMSLTPNPYAQILSPKP